MTPFDKLKGKLARRKGVHDAAALTAWIGRKVLGKKEFQHRAEMGRKKQMMKH